VGFSDPLNTRSVRPGSSDASGSQPQLHSNHPHPYHHRHNMPRATVSNQSRLAGRTAIVTGAGRGIGRAIAELYAREGARVVIASRSGDGSATAAQAIEAAGGTAIAKPTNVGIKSDVVDMVAFAVETFGSLDILVNSAQSWGTRDQPTGLPVPTPLESFDDAELDWAFDTGFRGTFWAMQAAAPHMRERGGRIINFASWYGAIGNAGTVGYNITKEATRALTQTAAREWARHAITVNVVEPVAKTDAANNIARADPEEMAAAVAAIPMGRLGDPHLDIAPAVVYLATDDARFITGQTPRRRRRHVSTRLTTRPLRATSVSRQQQKTTRQRKTGVHEATWVGSHRNRRARHRRNHRSGKRHR
jgi:NAD(P)-dependent dehydrogenase (short-subunit alcohol dehydrogenase family)